jgi:hypothetical protein
VSKTSDCAHCWSDSVGFLVCSFAVHPVHMMRVAPGIISEPIMISEGFVLSCEYRLRGPFFGTVLAWVVQEFSESIVFLVVCVCCRLGWARKEGCDDNTYSSGRS